MLIHRLFLFVGIVGAWLLGLSPAAALEPASRRELEGIVRDYLLKNPETIAEALRGLQLRQQVEEQQRTRQTVVAKQEGLLRDPDSPVAGNPGGDVTVVEFFDYRCGYCRAVAGTVAQLVSGDPGVRLVYKELPILGPESVMAAQAALAARAQGKYSQLHEALMKVSGPLGWDVVARIAAGVGLDVDRLKRDMQAPEASAAIERNRALARELGISGTPAFVVGNEVAAGALDVARLKALVTRARQR